jgi:hypothetical protein
MKRKICFQVTVGSYWPNLESQPPEHMSDVQFPQGGEAELVEIEFETEGGVDTMKDALNALKLAMGDAEYHYWYWWWLS